MLYGSEQRIVETSLDLDPFTEQPCTVIRCRFTDLVRLYWQPLYLAFFNGSGAINKLIYRLPNTFQEETVDRIISIDYVTYSTDQFTKSAAR